MTNIHLGTINGTGDGKELLLAAINRKTGRNYTLRDFEFGEPTTITNVPTPTHNTSIKFGPKLDSGYYGVRTIFYNRIHASDLGSIIVPYDGETRLHQLLDKINEKYGILITQDDVEDVVMQGVVGSQVSVPLAFKPASLIYYSSTQIQLGTNDPTGDTSLIMPFDPKVVMFFDAGQYSVPGYSDGESYEVSNVLTRTLSNDTTRYRDTLLSESFNTVGRSSTYLDRINVKWGASNLTKKDKALIAGTWIDGSTNAMSLLTRYGDVYKLKSDASTWQFVENIFGKEDAAPLEFSTYTLRNNIRAVAQAADSTVYVVASHPGGEWKLLKQEVGGSWQEVAVTKNNSVLFGSTDQERLFVNDAIVNDGKLWVLITSDHIYSVTPTTKRSPSVEVIDLVTGVVTVETITNITIFGSVIENVDDIDYNMDSYKFVTPPTGYPHVDVVAVGASKATQNIYAVAWRYRAGTGYAAEVLPITNSTSVDGFTFGIDKNQVDIAAEQVALSITKATLDGVSVPNHYLEVVYINCLVPSETVTQHFVASRTKDLQTYHKHSVLAASAVTTRMARSNWTYKTVELSGQAKPIFHIGTGPQRAIGIYQSDYAWLRVGGIQNPFVERFDLSAVLMLAAGVFEKNTKALQFGIAKAANFVISERSDVTYKLYSLGTAQEPIAYSFIAKQGSGTTWLTNNAVDGPLTKHALSPYLSMFGSVPALVAARGNDVMVISSRGYGAFISQDNGVTWKEATGDGSMYKHASGSIDTGIVGSAQLKLDYTNFNEASYFQDFLVAELSWDKPVKVYNREENDVAQELVLNDNILLRTGSSLDKDYEQGKLYAGKFNLLSTNSPRKVIAWDSDVNGVIEVIGYYDQNRGGSQLPERLDYYMFGIKGQLLDFSRDVKYLNVNHWVLVVQEGVYKLHFTNAIAPTKTIELFGGAGIFSNFKPEVNFHLWDFIDDAASYCPYIFYGAKKVLLLERLKQDGSFDVSQHNLSIPGDNGNAFTPVRMYTANRRDYMFAQKGNGIFKLNYTWDYQAEASSVTLVKVHDLSSTALRDIEPVAGCFTGVDVRSLPMEGLIPDMLPHGTLLGSYCDGYTKVLRFADGNNNYYEERIPNSKDCNYIEASLNQGIINNETV